MFKPVQPPIAPPELPKIHGVLTDGVNKPKLGDIRPCQLYYHDPDEHIIIVPEIDWSKVTTDLGATPYARR